MVNLADRPDPAAHAGILEGGLVLQQPFTAEQSICSLVLVLDPLIFSQAWSFHPLHTSPIIVVRHV